MDKSAYDMDKTITSRLVLKKRNAKRLSKGSL